MNITIQKKENSMTSVQKYAYIDTQEKFILLTLAVLITSAKKSIPGKVDTDFNDLYPILTQN